MLKAMFRNNRFWEKKVVAMLQVLHLECVKYTSDIAYSNYSRVDVVQAFSQHLALRLVYTPEQEL